MQTELTANPQISVVIPAYNSAAHLPATLQSVFAQSTPPAEVIVVDDGSADETAAIARSFGATVLSLANGGPSAARNAGTKAASGEYIAYLDADDIWVPEKLAVQYAALQSYGRPAFSFTDFRLFDDRGVYSAKSELLRRSGFRKTARGTRGHADILITAEGNRRPVLYESYILPSTALVRRSDALAVGGFDETLRAAEDYEFFLRLYNLVPAVVVLKPLLLYRQHAAQATSNAMSMKSGLFDVALRVAASPQRYPAADVKYIAETNYLRQYTLGVKQARVGYFDAAVLSFERSRAARPTARASFALLSAQICRSTGGRFVFTKLRNLWKRRPARRYSTNAGYIKTDRTVGI
jgi:glycosyltransferase involved in cell wall biosynthesis